MLHIYRERAIRNLMHYLDKTIQYSTKIVTARNEKLFLFLQKNSNIIQTRIVDSLSITRNGRIILGTQDEFLFNPNNYLIMYLLFFYNHIKSLTLPSDILTSVTLNPHSRSSQQIIAFLMIL